MTTYAPRTLLRHYNADKTDHITAVVLNDGKIFDISNKKTYESFDEWNVDRDQGGNMTIDTSKSEGVVIPSDWKGFTNSKGYTPHTDWIYRTMAEFTPHLLEREDIKNTFNNYQNVYADLVRNGSLHTATYYIKKGQSALIQPSEYTIPCGYRTYYSNQKNVGVGKELNDAYRPLYDLIHPELLPHLFERSEIERKKQNEKRNKYLIGVYKRRVDKYKKLIEHHQKIIEDLESK